MISKTKKKGNNKHFSGAVSLTVAVLVTKILGVMFKVPLSYILDDEGMGYFNTAYTIYGFFYILCTAGVPKAITIVIAERDGNNDLSSVTSIVRSSVKVITRIGSLVTVLGIIFAPFLVRLIGNARAIYTLYAILPSVIFVSASSVYRGYLNSRDGHFYIAVSQFAEAICKLSFGLAFSYLGVVLKQEIYVISSLAVLGITIGSAVSYMYLRICTKKKIRLEKNGQKSSIQYSALREIVKIALPISLGSMLLNLSGFFDMALIMRGMKNVGVSEAEANILYGNYSTLVVPMMNLVLSVITPITLMYLPHLTKNYHSDSKTDGETALIKNMVHIVDFIAMTACFAFYFYSFDLLDVLFASDASARGAELLISLSFGIMILSALTVVNTVLEAGGKILLTVVSLFAGSIVKIIVGYLLVSTLKLGIIGVPIATVISYFVSFEISVCSLRIIGIRTNIVKYTLLHFIFALFAFSIPFILWYSTGVVSNTLVSLSVCLFTSVLIYGVLIYMWYRVSPFSFNVKNAQK